MSSTVSQPRAGDRRPLYKMFTAVPPRYDIINRLITLGRDEPWRRAAVRECLAGRPRRFIDLCCGTGDLALNVARMAGEKIEIVGLDYSQPMLDIAARKAGPLSSTLSWVPGDATAIPFPDGHFDCAGISFGFRNLTYKNPNMQKHLSEVFRVLAPGGRFVIVESSQPANGFVRGMFHLYLRTWVYQIGALISGNRSAYRYLSESARRYYQPHEIREMLLKTGFRTVSYRPLFLGAAGIHVAVR